MMDYQSARNRNLGLPGPARDKFASAVPQLSAAGATRPSIPAKPGMRPNPVGSIQPIGNSTQLPGYLDRRNQAQNRAQAAFARARQNDPALDVWSGQYGMQRMGQGGPEFSDFPSFDQNRMADQNYQNQFADQQRQLATNLDQKFAMQQGQLLDFASMGNQGGNYQNLYGNMQAQFGNDALKEKMAAMGGQRPFQPGGPGGYQNQFGNMMGQFTRPNLGADIAGFRNAMGQRLNAGSMPSVMLPQYQQRPGVAALGSRFRPRTLPFLQMR